MGFLIIWIPHDNEGQSISLGGHAGSCLLFLHHQVDGTNSLTEKISTQSEADTKLLILGPASLESIS